MTLADWHKNGWLKPHAPDKHEIGRLRAVIARDLRVSGEQQTDRDWRFVAAYNAALQAATMALHAYGYQATKGGGAHFYTLESLKFTISATDETVDSLQAFKAKRAGSIYEAIGIASETEITELRVLASGLRDRVLAWLKSDHPHLLE